MRVLILGVGDAFTSAGFSTGSVIEAPDGFVMVDCSDLVHRALREATETAGWDLTPHDIHDVVLTHIHGDHANGLESFGFNRWVHRRKNADLPIPRLHTHPGVAERLWEKLAPAMDAPLSADGPNATLADFFEVHTFEPGSPFRAAGLTIESRYTKHPVPTTALKISDGRSTLGLSSDTEFDAGLIDWLADADLIIHEANRSPIHTDIDELNALPETLRAKMRLTHLEDGFDTGVTGIEPLIEGEVLEF